MSEKTSEQKVKDRWPDAELSFGMFGCGVVRRLTRENPMHARYESLGSVKCTASEAWEDAAERMRDGE